MITAQTSQVGQFIVTVEQLAEQARVSNQYIRRLLAAGKISGAYKVGNTWAIPRQVADRWLEQRKSA